jgi:hypothetical protein
MNYRTENSSAVSSIRSSTSSTTVVQVSIDSSCVEPLLKHDESAPDALHPLRQKCGLEMEVFHEWIDHFSPCPGKSDGTGSNLPSQTPKTQFPGIRFRPCSTLRPLAASRFRNNAPLLPGESKAREASQNRRPEHEALHRNLVPSSVSSFEHGFGRYPGPGYKVKLHVYGWSTRGSWGCWGCWAQII